MIERIADRYRCFARLEAKGKSPLYEMLALHVTQTPEALSFLMRLPRERQQPNLLFAAMRLVAGTPASCQDFDQALGEHADAIAEIMLSRTTRRIAGFRLPGLVTRKGDRDPEILTRCRDKGVELAFGTEEPMTEHRMSSDFGDALALGTGSGISAVGQGIAGRWSALRSTILWYCDGSVGG